MTVGHGETPDPAALPLDLVATTPLGPTGRPTRDFPVPGPVRPGLARVVAMCNQRVGLARPQRRLTLARR